MTEARRTRPGGRSARVRQAVLDAVLSLLDEGEYADLSVERLAERADVNKTTIYRRWIDLDGLLGDVLLEYGIQTVPIPDTGSFEQDLRVLAESLQTAMTVRPVGKIMMGLVAGAVRNDRAAEVLKAFVHERFTLAGEIVRRAIERGELEPDTDAFGVIETLGAPFYLRSLVTSDPIDVAFAQRAAAVAAAAAKAGVLALSKG